MTVYLRRDEEPPAELVGEDDRVIDVREALDMDQVIDAIFEADLVVVW